MRSLSPWPGLSARASLLLCLLAALASGAAANAPVLFRHPFYEGEGRALPYGDQDLRSLDFAVRSVQVPEGFRVALWGPLGACPDCDLLELVGNVADLRFAPVRAGIQRIPAEEVRSRHAFTRTCS